MDPVTICNMALGHLGASRIASLEDPSISTEAELCDTFFEVAVRQALAEKAWLFATGSKPLFLDNPQASGDPELPAAFALPGDVISVHRAFVEGDSSPLRWERRGNEIVAEQADRIGILATIYVADPNKWTPTFCSAVSYLLASKLAGPIADNAALANRMEERYERELKRAGVLDAMQGNNSPRIRTDPRYSLSGRR